MHVNSLLTRLSVGELSNLHLSGEGSGTIIANKVNQVLQHVNDGLTALHSRFILSQKDVNIEQMWGVNEYILRRKYAWTANTPTPVIPGTPYLRDTVTEPFMGDVIKILAIYNHCGIPYPINDIDHPMSLFTPQPDVVQVPCVNPGAPLAVVYQARHPIIMGVNSPNYLTQEINIPFSLENALAAYVAWKIYSNMNGQENLMKAQELKMIYEEECLENEAKDLLNQTTSAIQYKLEKRGFV
jgi:hypothetical protein